MELCFGKELNPKQKITLGGGWIKEGYLNASEVIHAGAPVNFSTNKGVFKLGITIDHSIPHYYKLDGRKNQLFFTHVWGKSFTENKTFFTLENQATYFKEINNSGNLALRLQASWARNIDSPFPPFAIDNKSNIRGVGNRVQRGNTYWAVNTEYRYTLFEKGWFALQGNGFVDVAGIQPVDKSRNAIFTAENNFIYSGIGLRFIHKYIYKAVLRIVYGIYICDNTQSGIVFGIGQFF